MEDNRFIRKGIVPEKAFPEDEICTIGFRLKDKKWYGLTLRKMRGFGIGDVVEDDSSMASYKEGTLCGDLNALPIGFKARTLDDCRLMAIAFAN